MQDTENKHRDQPFFDNICFIATAHNRADYGLSYSFAEENIFFTYLIFYKQSITAKSVVLTLNALIVLFVCAAGSCFH